MAAAVALTQAGIPVTVYESARRLGGRARAVDCKNGGTLDNGQHLLIGAYRDTLRLIETVGVPPARLWRIPLTWCIVNGVSFQAANAPAPWHLLWGLMRSSGWSIAARVRCMRFLAFWRSRRFALEHDVTVKELLSAHRQEPFIVRQLWEPLCVAALNTRIDEASARVFLRVVGDTLAADRRACEMLLPRSDLSALFPDPASKFIDERGGRVLLGTPASHIEAHKGAFTVETASTRDSHAAIIVACQPSRVAQLFTHIPALQPVDAAIARMSYEPIVTVYLSYSTAPRLPHPIVGFANGCTQWVFDRGEISGQTGLLAAVISARARTQPLSHAELAQRVHEEIASAFAPLDAPQWTQVIEEKRATIACTPHLERPDQQTPVAGLFLAGDYTRSDYPATLESAVRSGLRCAKLASEYLRPKSVCS